MPPYDDRDHMISCLAVAMLTSQERSQADIKELLGLSSLSDVSRQLSTAKKKGYFSLAVNWPADDPDIQSDVERRVFPYREPLLKKLVAVAHKQDGVPPESLRIIYTDTNLAPAEQITQFGQRAALHLGPFIKSARSCAVAWGKTIESIVNGTMAQREQHDVQFVPISGDPFNHAARGVSPSAAAIELARLFRCKDPALSLQGVATRIPKRMHDHAATIRDFFGSSAAYRLIFGSGDGLMKNIDMIITSVGDVASSKEDPWFNETVNMEDINDTNSLEQMASGNIGGVWLPRKPGHQQVDDINKRSLGIQLEHYSTCAHRRDRKDGKAQGVFVVGTGEQKAPILIRALGLANHIVIDDVLARRMCELLDVPSATRPFIPAPPPPPR